MLVLALLAATAAAQTPAASPLSAVREARATVRIVSGVRVSAGKLPEEAQVRDTSRREPDGRQQTLRLIEFP